MGAGSGPVMEEELLWDWPLEKDGNVKVCNTKEKFRVALLVHFFTPREIEVKVCGPDLVITCTQEPRPGSSICREIHRAYKLPPDVDLGTLASSLSKGTLVISAAKIGAVTVKKKKAA